MYRNNCYCKLKKEIQNEIKNLLNESTTQDNQLATQINTISNNLTSNTENDNKLKQKVDILEKILANQLHEYVDLGLPSGTKWATMNVGASSETDYGNYYMYGMGSKTYDSTDTPYADTEDPLTASADTATQVWGGSWHMPTRTQMQELTANTTYQWVTNYKGSGINGGTFTATNGAVLFIPAAGYWFNGRQYGVGSDGSYWGSSPNDSNDACSLGFSNGVKDVFNNRRGYGFSVRPVIG